MKNKIRKQDLANQWKNLVSEPASIPLKAYLTSKPKEIKNRKVRKAYKKLQKAMGKYDTMMRKVDKKYEPGFKTAEALTEN